jgi:5-formyltetrahydrofolate cyclo-ligase
VDGDVGAAKRALRGELLAVRRALPADRIATASATIVATLRTLPELLRPDAGDDDGPRGLLLYAADPDEVSLDGLAAAPPSGWDVLLPRVEGGSILPVPFDPGAPLAVGYRGIREPTGAAIGLGAVAAVVVPGVAFSPLGARLGRGAGMYDRLLPRLEGVLRIGVCLEVLVRDELPVEPHDAGVDVLVTDASVRRSPTARTRRPT